VEIDRNVRGFQQKLIEHLRSEKGYDTRGEPIIGLTRVVLEKLLEPNCAVRKRYEAERFQIAKTPQATTSAGKAAPPAKDVVEPLELPQKFQDAFEVAKARAESECATRAERFPNQPQFADHSLHLLALIQKVFFEFCTQARNAWSEGSWKM